VNRRSFLSMIGFVAPAVIVKPTYFLSPFGGWFRPETMLANTVEGYTAFRTATGLTLYYEQRFIQNLKAATPLVRFLRDPRLPKLVEASGYRLVEFEVDRVCAEVSQ
jgi:hypothetical protein